MNPFRCIGMAVRGCGNLPHVGPHPGTATVIVLIVVGAITGSRQGGWKGALVGALAMAIWAVPMYLFGGYDRFKDYEKYQNRSDKS